jgi:co-chaperonin GroES (HSP10)
MSAGKIARELRSLHENVTAIDPASLPLKVTLWRVLIEPVEPIKETAGGIALASSTVDAQQLVTSVGRILQLGAFAFKSKTNAGLNLADEPNNPKVGDYVLFEQYAGQEVKLRTGKCVRVLNDTEILSVVTDPDQIWSYI